MSPQKKLTRTQCAKAALLGTFLIHGEWVVATPQEAKEKQFTPSVLKSNQVITLEQLSEALVPGSTQAGIAAYIDNQLSRGSDSLLIAKYLNVTTMQQANFYITALNNTITSLKNSKVTIRQLVERMFKDSVKGWEGAPASFFLFLLRADGLDVTYGTEAGADLLDIPYSPHISPANRW